MSMKEWSNKLPSKNISELNPQSMSAADLVTHFNSVTCEDLHPIIDLDQRVWKDINIQLKYRTVIKR